MLALLVFFFAFISSLFLLKDKNKVIQAFFLTPAAEKTKTQEKNSSQKLKEKTQPLGGFSLQVRKLKKKTKISS